LYGLFVLSGIFIASHAQAPDVLWSKAFGEDDSDIGKSVLQTSDNGFLIAGSFSDSVNGNEVWLIRTDHLGNIVWEKKYGQTFHEYGNSVCADHNGGFVIAGSTNSTANLRSDAFLMRTDAAGNIIWLKTYGDSSLYESANSVKKLSDGGYILTGNVSDTSLNLDVLVIRTDSLGNMVWMERFGDSGSEEWGYSTYESSSGSFIITAHTNTVFGAGNYDLWLLSVDSAGKQLWSRTLGGVGDDYGYTSEKTSDGGFIITGTTSSFGNSTFDIWLIRLNDSGDTLWTKTYGNSDIQVGYAVTETADKGFIITGGSVSIGNESDLIIIRTNSEGDTLWTRTIVGSYSDYGNSVRQTSDGGYIVAGVTSVDGEDNSDVWLIRVDSENLTSSEEGKDLTQPSSFKLYQNYPNPFNPATKISWQSAVGRL